MRHIPSAGTAISAQRQRKPKAKYTDRAAHWRCWQHFQCQCALVCKRVSSQHVCAAKSSTNPVSGQETVSAQTASAQTDTAQTATEKMAGAFFSSSTASKLQTAQLHAKDICAAWHQTCAGSWQRQRTMQHPPAGKTTPGAPYHHAGTVQPGTDGSVTQNTQQEQAVHSQSESNPRGNASVQNRRWDCFSPGAAGKAAASNPLRSINQPAGAAGKSYHNSNAQGQTVRSESRSSAAPLCRLEHDGCSATGNRTSIRAGFSAIRYGRKSVRATQRRTVNICTKRYGRKTARFSFRTPPAIPQELVRGRSNQAARRNTPVPGTAGTQRTSIGGRYTQPVQQTTHVSTNGNTQITQQNHVAAQQSNSAAQPSGGTRMDGRSTNREHPAPTTPSPAAPTSSAKPVRPRARPRGLMLHVRRNSALRSAQFPAQGGSAEKPTPQSVTRAPSAASPERQSRKPAAPAAMGSVTAPAPVSQESRGLQRSTEVEPSAKRPARQEHKAGMQKEPQKKEQTLYHRPGTAGIAPTAAGINTEAVSAAQKPAAERTSKKPFVPLTGRTPESIPSHLDLHETSHKTTKRPQENKPEVKSDE